MASIGTTYPSTNSATGSSSTGSSSSSSSANGSDSLANQNTFLQLLVAQLQYQDPTQPMDGTTFVTQLATFSDLQANVGSKADLDAISKQYLNTAGTTSSTGTSSGTGSASGTAASGSPASGTTPTNGTGSSSAVTGG